MNRLLPVVPLLVSACAGRGDLEAEIERLKAQAPDPSARRVEVAEVRASDARLTLDLPGEVEGAEDALLASATGGLVEQVRVAEGQEVRKGDTLVVVDRELYAAQLDQAEANLAQARDDLRRTEALGEYAAAAELNGARTRVRVAEASARVARAQLERAVITAPFAGTVGSVGVSVGEMASPGAPLVRLVQLDPVVVKLSVSDRDVVALSPGIAARVRTHAAGETLAGTVRHISPVGDLKTRSFVVEVEVPNAERTVLPGMIAKVEVEVDVAEATVVLPQDWFVTRVADYGVFVVEDGVARWEKVELGDIVRGEAVVRTGVDVGDRVVTVGQHDLVDGDRVLVDRSGWCCRGGRAVFDDATASVR